MACDLTTNLWALFHFTGNGNDSSGNGRNLTNRGGVTYDTDKNGVSSQASSYDQSATNDCYDSSANVTLGTTFTINIWVYPTATANGDTYVCIGNHNTNDHLLFGYLIITTNKVEAQFNVGGTNRRVIENSTVTTNAWTMYTLTADGTTLKLFKNAVLQGSGTACTLNLTTAKSWIVGADADYGNRMVGKMDELSIFIGRAWDQDTLDAAYAGYDVLACAGITHKINGIAGANIAKVNGIAAANIAKINGITV